VQDAARRRLLDEARQRVSAADIEACAIAIDPSYPRYVEQLTTVLRTGASIERVDWEVMFHATRDDPDAQPEPDRYRRYRVLAAAVGALHPALAELVSPTDVAISLVEDAVALADLVLTAPAYAALRELAEELGERHESDAPFVWLAALLLGATAGCDDAELSALALRVFDEESRFQGHRKRSREKRFLWRCARSKLDEERWMRAIEMHLPSSTQSLASLRTVLLRRLTALR
jgi:hypothetical protein